MVLLGNTLQTTPDYLRQLKQSDHNVLYSEVCNLQLDCALVLASCGFALLVVYQNHKYGSLQTVRFGKALADVRRNLRDLQTENDQLMEESEV